MIKKIIILLAMLLFSYSFAEDEEIISGGIKYNEASARIEAFKDLPRKMDKKIYRKYLKDPNRKENIESIKKEVYTVDSRLLCPFYIKDTLASYAITYNDNEYMVFYYNIFGSLIRFDLVEVHEDYERTIGYSRYGNLVNVSFSAENDEQFVYDENGKLIAHWVEDEMVDKKMKFIKLTRKGGNLESHLKDEQDKNESK